MISSSEALVLDTLTGDAFVLVNKKLLRYFDGDCNAVVLLGELLAIHKYHLNNQSLDPDNSFPVPIKRFQYSIGMTPSKQERVFDLLEKEKICSTYRKGFPAQKYVSLNFDTLMRLLNNDEAQVKKLNQQEFYQEVNAALNTDPLTYIQNIENIATSCGNMNYTLKGTLILLSQAYLSYNQNPVQWDPEYLGKIRSWAGRRSFGKAFDFSIVTRTIDTIALRQEAQDSFKGFLSKFMETAKGVPDSHFSQQVYDYTELLSKE